MLGCCFVAHARLVRPTFSLSYTLIEHPSHWALTRSYHPVSFYAVCSCQFSHAGYLYRHFGNGTNVASGGIFEEYQLSTELGKGAFASVRRAHGIKDGKTYAVKVGARVRTASSATVQLSIRSSNNANGP